MRIILFDELRTRFGIKFCRLHIDRLERSGAFPKRVKLTRGCVGWVEQEIEQWLADRAAARFPAAGCGA